MRLIFTILAILAVVATALPLSTSDRWWVRIWDFPRLQITWFILIPLTGLLACFWIEDTSSLDILLIILLLLALAHQSYMMFPYTRFARPQVEKSRRLENPATISLLFANVLMQNRDADALLAQIRDEDPDIVLAVETDAWWSEQLTSLARTHPHTVLQPQENEYGMVLYSRLKLTNDSVKFLIDDAIPSIHATAQLGTGDKVELRCLHPRPPFPTEDDSSTDRDAEVLIVGREIKDTVHGPAIVFGDLNDVAWSRTNYLFQNISGLLDPRVGRGFFNTFHAGYPIIRFPLDHFFHSNHFRLVDFRRLPFFGSDHFPVYIKLTIEADAVTRQHERNATPEEREEADAKIEAAR